MADELPPDPRVADATARLLEACGGPGAEYATALAGAGMVTVYTLLEEKGIATPDEMIAVYSAACRGMGVELNERRALEALLDGS